MKQDTDRESRFFPTPPAFDTLVSGLRPRRNIAITKICLFVSTEYTKVTESGRTDRRRQCDGTGRAARLFLCIASRGKNDKKRQEN